MYKLARLPVSSDSMLGCFLSALTSFLNADKFVDTIRTIKERYIFQVYLLGAALLPIISCRVNLFHTSLTYCRKGSKELECWKNFCFFFINCMPEGKIIKIAWFALENSHAVDE